MNAACKTLFSAGVRCFRGSGKSARARRSNDDVDADQFRTAAGLDGIPGHGEIGRDGAPSRPGVRVELVDSLHAAGYYDIGAPARGFTACGKSAIGGGALAGIAIAAGFAGPGFARAAHLGHG